MEPITTANLGARIKRARDLVNYTQEEVAASCSVNYSALRNWEKGHSSPSARNFAIIKDWIERVEAGQVTRQGVLPGEIRWLRQALGDRQEDFAKRIGVASPTVSRWETGAVEVSRQMEGVLRPLIREQLQRRQLTEVPLTDDGEISDPPAILGGERNADMPEAAALAD